MKIFIATKNQKKLAELKRILLPMGLEAVCEADLDNVLPEVEETGVTFEENALLKARSGVENTGLISVADDSGLCVDALDGAPGVFSARYCETGDDEDNNDKLLYELRDVPMEKRDAHYVSVIACVFPDGREFTVRGECHGKIGFERDGTGGFGYDPLFIGQDGIPFGQLTAEQKDAISHRGKSLLKFKEEIKKYI